MVNTIKPKKEILKAAIFDFDDTLMATRINRISILSQVALGFGYGITTEAIKQHWGKPFDKLIIDLMPGIEYEVFIREYSAAMRLTPPIVQPGALRVLQALQERSIIIVVVSSGSRELVNQDLCAGGLRKYISKVWGYENTQNHKPHPKTLDPIVLELAERDISVNNTIYVGDSISDYKVANVRKIFFIGVLSGICTRDDFRAFSLEEEQIIESLNEFHQACNSLFLF